VDFERNLWFDHGTGEGGSIIDLVAQMNNCTVAEAIRKLELSADIFSFHRQSCLVPEHPPSAIKIRKVQPLANPALLDYLRQRKIDVTIAGRYCQDVYYSVGARSFFAVGFLNDAGGFELRSKYFKGCTMKAITTLPSGSDKCLLFEGFIDFLSYLTIYNKVRANDFVVLNSVANMAKALDALNGYKAIDCYFDHDDAGKTTFQKIKNKYGDKVFDKSELYRGVKDLNEYLMRIHGKDAVV
jgi:hypothetical protein